ncbi:hypothetical protein [Nocardia huaxiensis]|uniref:hypothetical protein n=1 Tax=Nocardia huaxiensis TaxID=2755382 RepID=UPI001E592EA2|nr:hypothetical protein [Nocardia huaxiensis]UFS93748.1 hypothetical protein LPY97_23460 [Nocardia huaxiensis]
MVAPKLTNKERMALAERIAHIAALNPIWTRDRIGREVQLPEPRGAREKSVLRLLQLTQLPKTVKDMFVGGEISFAATEELGAHRGLTDDEKAAIACKISMHIIPAGGKQLRAVLDWLSAAKYHEYGKRFISDVEFSYPEALKMQDETEARRQDAIDREAEKKFLARAVEAEMLGPQIIRELDDVVDRLRVMDELVRYVAHDRISRPRVTALLLNARALVAHMLTDVRHEEDRCQTIDG